MTKSAKMFKTFKAIILWNNLTWTTYTNKEWIEYKDILSNSLIKKCTLPIGVVPSSLTFEVLLLHCVLSANTSTSLLS